MKGVFYEGNSALCVVSVERGRITLWNVAVFHFYVSECRKYRLKNVNTVLYHKEEKPSIDLCDFESHGRGFRGKCEKRHFFDVKSVHFSTFFIFVLEKYKMLWYNQSWI